MEKLDLSMECFKDEVMQSLQQIYNKLGEIEEKLNEKPNVWNKPNINRDSTYNNKRNIYLGKLNSNEIITPKPQTLEYYKINYDEKTKTYSYKKH